MGRQNLQKFREDDYNDEDNEENYPPEPKICKDKKKVKFRVIEKDSEFGFWTNDKQQKQD